MKPFLNYFHACRSTDEVCWHGHHQVEFSITIRDTLVDMFSVPLRFSPLRHIEPTRTGLTYISGRMVGDRNMP